MSKDIMDYEVTGEISRDLMPPVTLEKGQTSQYETPEQSGVSSLENLDEALLARVRLVGAGATLFPQSQQPEQMRLSTETVVSVRGEILPGPNESYNLYDHYRHDQADADSLPKRILDRIWISDVTGCWLPDYYRDHAGYTGSSDRHIGLTESGQMRTHRSTRAHHELDQGRLRLSVDSDVEHICRYPTCCFPGHTVTMSSQENNQRKDDAREMEMALVSGNLIMAKMLEFFGWDKRITSDIENVIMASRFGLYRFKQINKDAIERQLIDCQARKRLRPLGKKPVEYEHTPINADQLPLAA